MRSIMMKNYSVYVAHIEFDDVPTRKLKMLISRSFIWTFRFDWIRCVLFAIQNYVMYTDARAHTHTYVRYYCWTLTQISEQFLIEVMVPFDQTETNEFF